MTTFFADYGRILIAVLAALAGIYLLLPRPRNYPPLWGALVCALALFVAGSWLIQAEVVWVETLLFYCFAGLAVVAGGLMITQQKPVHAALSFALVVLSTCGLFLLQAAPFLMAATIVVYAGAIVVTFLFVIMLAQQAGQSSADHRSREPFLATVAGMVLLGALLCVLQRGVSASPKEDLLTNLDVVLKKIDTARHASRWSELTAALGDEEAALESLQSLAASSGDHAKNYREALREAVDDARLLFATFDQNKQDPSQLRKAKLELERVAAQGHRLRTFLASGSLMPSPKLTLSDYSGTPPNVAPLLDRYGRPRMPSENVAAIGRSLFTDYLLAVELAATLLLVATIGAIAISVRRTEALR